MGTTTNENGLARPGSWGNGVVSCPHLPLAALSDGYAHARAHTSEPCPKHPPLSFCTMNAQRDGPGRAIHTLERRWKKYNSQNH